MTTSSATEQIRACPDPDCVDQYGRPSPAEPETDGDTAYHACTRCGYAFGWHPARPAGPNPDTVCPVGIPEAVRRAGTPPPPGRTLLPLTPIRSTP